MLMAALTNILEHENRGERPTQVLLIAVWGEQGVLDHPSLCAVNPKNKTSPEAIWRMNLGWEPRERTSLERCFFQPGLGPDCGGDFKSFTRKCVARLPHLANS